MKLFNKVAIIGTGLIGGSMALDLRRMRLAREIVGYSRHKSSLILARNKRVIDEGSLDLDVVKDADLVILATPVNSILSLSDKIAEFIPKDCIVTDVGSTKKEIVSRLSRIFPNYVGSHPLAGSEKRGIANIASGIFKNSLCILTPVKSTNPKALKAVKALWDNLGAKTVILSPDTHDATLSFVSHLPHAVAFSLIDTVPLECLRFAASGLKDTTRIAMSDEKLWTDIFLSNRKNMIDSIDCFQNKLSAVKRAILKKDAKKLTAILRKAKNKREVLK
jgi:prephenate dehydrogenase